MPRATDESPPAAGCTLARSSWTEVSVDPAGLLHPVAAATSPVASSAAVTRWVARRDVARGRGGRLALARGFAYDISWSAARARVSGSRVPRYVTGATEFVTDRTRGLDGAARGPRCKPAGLRRPRRCRREDGAWGRAKAQQGLHPASQVRRAEPRRATAPTHRAEPPRRPTAPRNRAGPRRARRHFSAPPDPALYCRSLSSLGEHRSRGWGRLWTERLVAMRPALAILCGTLAAVWLLAALGVTGAVDRDVRRLWFAVRGDRPATADVILVAIDGATGDRWGPPPYPWQRYQDTIGAIAAGHPRVIAVLDPGQRVLPAARCHPICRRWSRAAP